MRLIIAAGIYPPDIGGPATYSKKIAEEFSKRGWDVIVAAYANQPQSSVDDGAQRECESPPERMDSSIRAGESARIGRDGFKVIRVSRSHNVIARYFLYIWNLCKLAKRADLIYAQGPVSEGLPAYLASKITGKKYVLKIVGDPAWERMMAQKHENTKTQKQGIRNSEIKKLRNWKLEIGNYNAKFIDLEEFQEMKGLPLKTRILRWVERMVAKNAKKIITPSGYLKRIVMGWGIPDSKAKVIYNSVNEEDNVIGGNYEEIKKLRNSPREMKQAISRGKEIGNLDGDIILSAGRLVPWKGFDLLIDLMPELLKVNPKFKLVIAGDGQEMASLKLKVKSLKYKKPGNSSIVLIGKLEHDKLMQLMDEAKIFVLNSGYEGLPHVVIEAMQVGIPCAISNKGGNPELVEDGKTGILFDYNNREQIISAIKRLWKDENLRERIVAGGYEKIKGFGVERMVEETMEVLEIGN